MVLTSTDQACVAPKHKCVSWAGSPETGTQVGWSLSPFISFFFLPMSVDRADFLINANHRYNTKVHYKNEMHEE